MSFYEAAIQPDAASCSEPVGTFGYTNKTAAEIVAATWAQILFAQHPKDGERAQLLVP
jgi:hypothetical protein